MTDVACAAFCSKVWILLGTWMTWHALQLQRCFLLESLDPSAAFPLHSNCPSSKHPSWTFRQCNPPYFWERTEGTRRHTNKPYLCCCPAYVRDMIYISFWKLLSNSGCISEKNIVFRDLRNLKPTGTSRSSGRCFIVIRSRLAKAPSCMSIWLSRDKFFK